MVISWDDIWRLEILALKQQETSLPIKCTLPELKHKLFNCQKSILYFHFLSISYVTDKVLQPFYGPRTPHWDAFLLTARVRPKQEVCHCGEPQQWSWRCNLVHTRRPKRGLKLWALELTVDFSGDVTGVSSSWLLLHGAVTCPARPGRRHN